jgi:hypothetical protein
LIKLSALLLVIANIVFFAYWQGYFAYVPGYPFWSSGDDPMLRQPLNPEKIRLLSGAQVASLPKTRIVPRMSGCLEWGGFNPADEARAEQALQGFSLGDRITQRRQDETAGWWVYLPPQGSKSNVDKKISELKKLGVDDFFPIQEDGKWHFAVSLGVFSSQEAANKRLETLRAKGVRTAQAGQRDSASQKVFMQIRDGGDAVVARVNELKASYPGTDAKACAAPDKNAATTS